MAAIIPQGKTQFFNTVANGGAPLANGKVFFYVLNTTTYQNTYQDILLSILNPNPVVLDANGEASIWCLNGATYTMLVQDQYGNQVYQANTQAPAGPTNAVNVSASTTLTVAQSGGTIIPVGLTGPITLTLPTNALGLNYSVYGNGSYQVTVTAPAGNIYLPDGTFSASYVLPASYEQEVFLIADGTNWRAINTGAVNLTTLVAAGLITPASSIGIKGTTAADNAQAGSVGELLTASVTGASMTNNTVQNLLASPLVLTAGDWDVSGQVNYSTTGTGGTGYAAAINTVSATFPTQGGALGYSYITLPTTLGNQSLGLMPSRINVSASQNVYLVGYTAFTGTCTASGYLRARRVR